MINKHKISVIIPYYNGSSFYTLLLKSIKDSILVINNFNVSFEIITIIDSVETSLSEIESVNNLLFKELEQINCVVKKNKKNATGSPFVTADHNRLFCQLVHSPPPIIWVASGIRTGHFTTH